MGRYIKDLKRCKEMKHQKGHTGNCKYNQRFTFKDDCKNHKNHTKNGKNSTADKHKFECLLTLLLD